MLDGLVKYDSYKDSGVRWIDEVPSDWSSSPLVALATPRKTSGHPHYELLSVYLDRGVIRFSDVAEKRTNTTSEDLSNYQVVEVGNFVLNNQQAWRGSVGVSEHQGIVSPAYIVLELSSKLDPRFANYLFRDQTMVAHYLVCSKGVGTIQRNLYWPSLKRVPVYYPDLDTQNRIVKFLDEKTAEIDAAIEKKRRLIDLLNEQKAILINRAVTKGLNPNAPMKDSGVDWIGEIPAHWDVKRFKHCVRTQSGQVDPTRSPYKEMVLIAPNHIVQGTGETLPFETADEQGADSGKYFANAGCIIYSKIRPKLNKACIVEFDALCSADMYALQGYPEYFTQQYLLRQVLSECFVTPAVDASMRVAMPKVNREAMAEFPMIIPPKSEQEEIVGWLDGRLADVRAPEKATQKEIATLNEFKQTLIANAVTGKIKI
jgi:type I restriction enzyme S subunit